MKSLEDRERKHAIHKEQLSREHRFLRRRLEQLTSQTGLHGLHALHGLHGLSQSAPTGSTAAASAALLSKRRSISECSLGTASVSSSGSSRNSDRSAGSPSVSESGEYFEMSLDVISIFSGLFFFYPFSIISGFHLPILFLHLPSSSINIVIHAPSRFQTAGGTRVKKGMVQIFVNIHMFIRKLTSKL